MTEPLATSSPRRCAADDCTTVLSRYNESRWCAVHEQGKSAEEDQRRVFYAGKHLSPSARERQRRGVSVKNGAVRRLVEIHREEFDQLLGEEWSKVGLSAGRRG